MRQSDIRAGETYHNGRGRLRRVIVIKGDEVHWVPSSVEPRKMSKLATFARWAKGGVER